MTRLRWVITIRLPWRGYHGAWSPWGAQRCEAFNYRHERCRETASVPVRRARPRHGVHGFYCTDHADDLKIAGWTR